MLTAAQACVILGVPEAQLRRWAWLGVGPVNSGTRHKPRYLEDDLTAYLRQAREWRGAQ